MSTPTPQLPAPRAKFHWFLPTAGDRRADLILEYHSLDFDEFILSGHPYLEVAYWFTGGVLPILRRKGVA